MLGFNSFWHLLGAVCSTIILTVLFGVATYNATRWVATRIAKATDRTASSWELAILTVTVTILLFVAWSTLWLATKVAAVLAVTMSVALPLQAKLRAKRREAALKRKVRETYGDTDAESSVLHDKYFPTTHFDNRRGK